MTRTATSLLVFVLTCASSSAGFSRENDPLNQEDVERRAKYQEVYGFDMRTLLFATLSKSKDLARKGKNTYFCEYVSAAGPRPCDRMDTVSGQYEDYYQSQMACNDRCPRADINQNSWNYITGGERICRDLADGSCEKTALTVDQIREELIDLLEMEEQMRHRP